jgi:phosphoribosyl-AMP cyclohydrolase
MLDLVDVRINCEQNSLLYLVRPRGKGACHTKDRAGTPRRTCYYRRLKDGKLEHL